jgi:hypothetical protein
MAGWRRPLAGRGLGPLAALLAFLAVTATAEAVPIGQPITALVPFATAPFPYDGIVPDTGEPFLDVTAGGRRGHAAPRGGVYWEDETYADDRTLLFIPAGFDPQRPAAMVVYFHGNNATLEYDVLRRQRIAEQLQRSGINAVLAAPQFAIDALDSSAGRFWRSGAFRAWLGEAADRFAEMIGDGRLAAGFDRLPVILAAYSGGYLPAAYALTVGGAGPRICGAVLFDAVYGETALFADWIAGRGVSFFFSAYTGSSAGANNELQGRLAEAGILYARGLSRSPFDPGAVTFLSLGGSVDHEDFLTRAWRADPLQWALSEIAARNTCGL